MSELIGLSVGEMRNGLLQRKFSAVELVRAHLERIKTTNEVLNSFITVTEEQAIKQAAVADKTLADKGPSSPALTGVPLAVKDNIVSLGVETTCASKILKGFIPPYDSTVNARLKREGAILVGKTNLDEFGMGSSNENSAYGPARNPYDTSRVPGGTSGGSAIAVSVGQSPLSLGTDTGGSIRQPAALCGVLGLKPTYGRVSRYGAVAYASSLDQIGPLARTVPDLALCLKVIAGQDELDSTSMKNPVPDYPKLLESAAAEGDKQPLAGIRLGIPKEYLVEGIQPDVEAAVQNGLKTLENLGAKLVQISLPHTSYATAVYYVVAPAEASSNLARYDGVRYGTRAKTTRTLTELYEQSRALGFGPEVKRRIMIGAYVLSAGYYDAYYLKAQQVRTLIINDFRAAFANSCDCIVCPVSPTTAFKLGEKMGSPLQMWLADIFTIPTSLAGLPGLSVPCGMSSAGLPIGMQLIGAPFTELELLKIAQSYLQHTEFDTGQMTRVSGFN